MVIELTDADVKLNVPNDNPPKFIVLDAAELLIVDDPALKVKFVFVENTNVDNAVIVLVPNVIDRVFELLDEMVVHTIARRGFRFKSTILCTSGLYH